MKEMCKSIEHDKFGYVLVLDETVGKEIPVVFHFTHCLIIFSGVNAKPDSKLGKIYAERLKDPNFKIVYLKRSIVQASRKACPAFWLKRDEKCKSEIVDTMLTRLLSLSTVNELKASLDRLSKNLKILPSLPPIPATQPSPTEDATPTQAPQTLTDQATSSSLSGKSAPVTPTQSDGSDSLRSEMQLLFVSLFPSFACNLNNSVT